MRFSPVLAVALVAVLATPSFGWISVENQPLDHALYAQHGPRAVLAGTIREVVVEEGQLRELSPPKSEIRFEIEQVVNGAGAKAGHITRYSTRSFSWPTTLLPLEAEQRCILVVDPERREGFDGRLMTVLPWRGGRLAAAEDRAGTLRAIASELAAQIAVVDDDFAKKRELVILAAPLLTAEQATKTLRPLVDHKDIWLCRAAIAGLALASPTYENLARAVADMEAFAEATPKAHLIDGIEHGARYAAYPFYFRNYRWLRTDWSMEQRERVRAHIWLHRTVARTVTNHANSRLEYGIRPLCTNGDATDLRQLYEYYMESETNGRGAIHERPSTRMAVLRRLTKLLNIELIASEVPELGWHLAGIAKEPEQLELIRDALKRRGVDWL